MTKPIGKEYISELDTSFELYKYPDGEIKLCIEVPNPNPRGLGNGETVEISLDELGMRRLRKFINKHLSIEGG